MKHLFAAMPILAFAYVLIGDPLMGRLFPGAVSTQMVWPGLFAATLLLAASCWRDLELKRFATLPMLLLGVYLGFAGLSVLWAYSPQESLKRWFQAILVVVTICLPLALRAETPKLSSQLFWCYALSLILSGIFVLTTPPLLEWTGEELGHPGYFLHKQYMGMCGSVALLLAAYVFWQGRARPFALAVAGLAIWMILESKSKTSLGFLMLAPVIGWLALTISRRSGRSILLVLSAIPLSFWLLSLSVNNLTSRIAYRLYGDSTLTGRVFIWDFVETQTALRPLLGWGYHSFWFVPFSPSQTATGFVRDMPASHSGYLDVRLELGYVGLVLFLAFIAAVIVQFDKTRIRRPQESLLLLSLLIYIMVMNWMETIWFIHFDPLWILSLLITTETVRTAAATRRADATLSQTSNAAFAAVPKLRPHRFPELLPGLARERPRRFQSVAK
jgi:exopolysaccharide production protein ExoQ